MTERRRYKVRPRVAVVPPEGGSLSPRAVSPDYVIDHETGCWNWQKFKRLGYGTGSFTAAGIKSGWAHRAYYIAANGPIEDGDEIHHKCRNPSCVNPDHLERISQRDHDVISFLGDRAGGLTLDDVRAIRELGRTAGVTAKQVAEQYGIHEITVYNYWGKEPVWADLLGDDPICKPVLTCAWCGVEFTGRLRNARYCSKAHVQAASNARKRAA